MQVRVCQQTCGTGVNNKTRNCAAYLSELVTGVRGKGVWVSKGASVSSRAIFL